MKKINSNNAPAALGPYSQAILAGNTLYVSGQLPINPENGILMSEITAATKQCLVNISNILIEAGFELANVVKVNIFMSNLDDFSIMNEAYNEFFNEPYPARACIEVKSLPKNSIIEIECIAVL